MSDSTNNEETTEVEVTEVPETTDTATSTPDAAETVAEVAATEPAVEGAAATPAAAPVAEVAAATPAAERSGPVITTPVVKETKAAVVDEDASRVNPRKVREGIVISDKMDMTLVVAVNERVRHPRYGKTVQRTKKLYVHDEKNDAKVGDRVRVQETRPLSKLKRWRLTEVVERAR
jgi:small subunit ribosomal protein S17